jgi:hypothetical protein
MFAASSKHNAFASGPIYVMDETAEAYKYSSEPFSGISFEKIFNFIKADNS